MEGTGPPAVRPGGRPPPHRQFWRWYRSQAGYIQWGLAIFLVILIIAAIPGSDGGGGGDSGPALQESVIDQQRREAREDERAARSAVRKARAQARLARATARRERARARRAARRARAARAARVQRERERRAERERQQALEEQAVQEESQPADCEAGYDPCVPPYPPDLDCGDLGGPYTVTGSDPHGLDADRDGSGCE